MSFFIDFDEAVRYAYSRPYFHPLAIARAVKSMEIEGTVPIALDIACGTGQSTTALASISEWVLGLDISWSMLANTAASDRVQYALAQAEMMPLKDECMPFASCALAFHWFDRDRFLQETWRVLKPGGWLLIYNNGFTGMMREKPGFYEWSSSVYPQRFPTPPRDSRPVTKEAAASAGFVLIEEDKYENEVSLTPRELAAYLITQTNVVAALNRGSETVESASGWLFEQVKPYFVQEKATFVFRTTAWYLRKGVIRRDTGKAN